MAHPCPALEELEAAIRRFRQREDELIRSLRDFVVERRNQSEAMLALVTGKPRTQADRLADVITEAGRPLSAADAASLAGVPLASARITLAKRKDLFRRVNLVPGSVHWTVKSSLTVEADELEEATA